MLCTVLGLWLLASKSRYLVDLSTTTGALLPNTSLVRAAELGSISSGHPSLKAPIWNGYEPQRARVMGRFCQPRPMTIRSRVPALLCRSCSLACFVLCAGGIAKSCSSSHAHERRSKGVEPARLFISEEAVEVPTRFGLSGSTCQCKLNVLSPTL